jgi:hypothetical protein
MMAEFKRQMKRLIPLNLTLMLLWPLCRGLYSQEDGRQWIERIVSSYEKEDSYHLEGTVHVRIDGFRKFLESESFERFAKPKENKILSTNWPAIRTIRPRRLSPSNCLNDRTGLI